jgi:hypothetical protein
LQNFGFAGGEEDAVAPEKQIKLPSETREVTSTGFKTLQKTLPNMIVVQGRLFGQAGLPGGGLHRDLLREDSDPLEVTCSSDYLAA